MLSSMRKLKEVAMSECPKLDEIHIAGVLESLEILDIFDCESFRRFVYVDTHWESSHESSLILASRVFNKLWRLSLQSCDKILSIQVVGMSESLEELAFSGDHLQSVCGLSNLKYLKSFEIFSARELQIVKGLDELKFLNNLTLMLCCSLESLIDVSTTQLPNDCHIYILCCSKLRGLKRGIFNGSIQSFKHYKVQELGAPSPCFSSNHSRSDEVDEQQLMLINKRRQGRMISNRKSACRSRMRKPRHLDELWLQTVWLCNVNHQLIDKLNHMSEINDKALEEDLWALPNDY
ncbi:hypothetical protein NL676_009095 [Syzygium grande]|nr:hypothetical protein NL676_009095 [Syzygium grande]